MARRAVVDHVALLDGGDVFAVSGGWVSGSGDAVARTGGQVRLHELAAAEIDRMAVLMEKYQDRPMDLADASLVTAAERLGIRQVT